MTVWIDVEDLFHYFETGHVRVSGIQRVAFETSRAAVELGACVRFVRHAPAPDRFIEVPWPLLAAKFETPPAEPSTRAALPERAARALLRRLPDEVRAPLVRAVVAETSAFCEMGRLLRAVVQTLPARPRPGGFAQDARAGDTLLVLGAPWSRDDYAAQVRWLQAERHMRFGLVVHDLAPVRRPEWVAPSNAERFVAWHSEMLPLCDVVFADSRYTADDVEIFRRELGIIGARPVQVLPIGTGFAASRTSAAETANPALPQPGSYALFVSTLEARKNHALAVKVWSLLLDEVAAGRRTAASVPDLVFAGRVGWLVGDLIRQLENTAFLGGRIHILRDLTDSDLAALYAGCRFTLFPSFHEGWGLPVAEKLAAGKPCLSSNAASLPEVGGALCRYFDPEDLGDAVRAVSALLDDPVGLAAWEARVRADFRPTPWTVTARALLETVARL